jgi:hypothetical protein
MTPLAAGEERLFELFVRVLEDDGWAVERHETEPAFRVRFGGESGEWECFAQIRASTVLFYSASPVEAPADRMADACELVARANWGLPLGNLQLDLDTGEILFKTSVDVEGIEVDGRLLKHLVYANVVAMARYLPAIESLLSGASPAAAIASAEGRAADG